MGSFLLCFFRDALPCSCSHPLNFPALRALGRCTGSVVVFFPLVPLRKRCNVLDDWDGDLFSLPAAVREAFGFGWLRSRVVPRTPDREEITARTGRAFSAKRTYKMPLTGSSCKGRREDSIFIFLYDSHSCGQNHRGDASGNVWNRGNLRMHLSFSLFWCRTMLHQ